MVWLRTIALESTDGLHVGNGSNRIAGGIWIDVFSCWWNETLGECSMF